MPYWAMSLPASAVIFWVSVSPLASMTSAWFIDEIMFLIAL